MKKVTQRAAIALLTMLLPIFTGASTGSGSHIRHVLVVSVDGLHAVDVRKFEKLAPESTMAWLARNGVEYTHANTPSPADSFPGLLALFTGGTPAATGVYYDVSYDRHLSPANSHCHRVGTVVVYDESADALNERAGDPLLDARRLPRDPKGCHPVFPHSYLRVNTVFEVVRRHAGYTAWIDKHPVYEILNGPSGRGVEDLYTPEIGSNFNSPADRGRGKITASISRTERYDASKVQAVINEISGFSHDGRKKAPVPTVFGLNLQTLNVAQKLSGYADAQGDFTAPLVAALSGVDAELGKIVAALHTHKLLSATLIIVTAKHGNGPIDPHLLRHVDRRKLASTISAAAPGALAWITSDHGALIWLRDQTETATVAHALEQAQNRLGIERVLYGTFLTRYFPAPTVDSRSPDLVIVPKPGTIYAKAGSQKKMEHGGFLADDTHVALLVYNPALRHAGASIDAPVSTTQVAPTILQSLGISPLELRAVAIQGTQVLPGESWAALGPVRQAAH